MGAIAKFKPRYRADNADLALSHQESLQESSASWVNALRQRGAMAVSEMGLPTQKLERWKYTNLPAKLKKLNVAYADADTVMNGMTDYASPFSKIFSDFPEFAKDMIEGDLPSHDKYGDMALWSFGDAMLKDGFVLDVPKETSNNKELEITSTGHEGQFTSSRQIMRVQAGSKFTLIEYQSGSGQYWSNFTTQIIVEKGARFNHYRFQENDPSAVVTHNTHIVIEQGAEYEGFTLTSGADLSRNQIHVDIKGDNATCRVNGINTLHGSQNANTTITVDHHAPHCNSFQNYRTVVDEKATSTFQGKIHVHKPAQKTDGYQMAKSLLLSGQSTINTKPELEIYADDVKCSHGATTGRLDSEALFYLQSRGIPEKKARDLMIQAFAAEVVEEISNEDVQEQVSNLIHFWLNRNEG